MIQFPASPLQLKHEAWTMAICDCTFSDVADECVLKSIEEWLPCYSIICEQCFMDIPLESGHECVELSKEMILLRMLDVLTTAYVCDEIYQTFTVTHTDSIQVLRGFLEIYKKILTDSESKDRIRLILWLKDALHGWTCNNYDCHSF